MAKNVPLSGKIKKQIFRDIPLLPADEREQKRVCELREMFYDMIVERFAQMSKRKYNTELWKFLKLIDRKVERIDDNGEPYYEKPDKSDMDGISVEDFAERYCDDHNSNDEYIDYVVSLYIGD